MTKEMLFLCDVYTNWCDSQNLPNFYSADDLCYGRDTKDKLTLKQKNWLETFIDVWDVINQNIPNPVDLCRILNYNLNGKVLGYNVKFDDIIPFYDDDVEAVSYTHLTLPTTCSV